MTEYEPASGAELVLGLLAQALAGQDLEVAPWEIEQQPQGVIDALWASMLTAAYTIRQLAGAADMSGREVYGLAEGFIREQIALAALDREVES